MKKFREWVSIKTVKSPRLIVLLFVLAANVIFILAAALIISRLIPPSMEDGGFLSSLYNTIMMYLGIGGIEMVIEEISEAGIWLVITCSVTVVIGMVVFMYALIGYMSEVISSFVADADSTSRRLRISGHIVILNWNTRAAEIVNELLYKDTKEKVVILTGGSKDDVLEDIEERISATIESDGVKNKLTIIVREGDSWSAKHLNDISIKLAKSVIILGSDISGEEGGGAPQERGNTNTIKTLLEVSQLVGAEDSADFQKVIVEAEDDWTLEIVNTIIKYKESRGKNIIVPVAVNSVLGQIFSQFSIMPELNKVYSTLLSNKGAAFYTLPAEDPSLSEDEFVSGRLESYFESIPLTVTRNRDGDASCCYMAGDERHIRAAEASPRYTKLDVSLNPDYEISDKHVIILGHNSKSGAIMEGFNAFSEEWRKKDGSGVLDIVVIDGEASLAKHGYYSEYPFVKKAVAADIFDSGLICGMIGDFLDAHGSDGCIMILSDDAVSDKEIDDDALTYLILVQDIIHKRASADSGFNPENINMIVEILDPKNYDIVSNYSAQNIVISDRYISKIIMQIGEKDALFDFYTDILTYDEPGAEAFSSKEIYAKKASDFFSAIPGPCTAAELIRAVYHASPEDNRHVVLGYFRADGEMALFEGDQTGIHVKLSGEDKLIVFSNH